jgi:hypothetical protein
LPVEPGAHRITAYAGDESDSHAVTVGAGKAEIVNLQFGASSQAEPETRVGVQQQNSFVGQDQPGEEVEPNLSKTVVIAAGAVTTTAALASAVLLTANASNLRGDARDMKQALGEETDCRTASVARCSSLAHTADSAEDRQTLGNRLFLVSGILAATTVATWVLWPDPKATPGDKGSTTPHTGVVPRIGPAGAAVLLVGSF